jgi:uncharacterized protein YbjT (DUF2867 family)
MPKIALVAGATGLTGKYLVNLLLQDKNYSLVKVITRRNMNYDHPKIQEIITDFDKLPELEKTADLSADDFYCCLGTTIKKVGGDKNLFYKVDHDYPVMLAEIAEKRGARNFLVVSSVGANKKSIFFYSRVKGAMEVDVKKFKITAIHIFRPSLLLGKRDEKRTAEDFAQKAGKWTNFIWKGFLRKYKPVDARIVAKAMITAANSGDRGIFIHEGDF